MAFTIVKFITLLGLCYDVIGAWYISRGIMYKAETELARETGFSAGPNHNYIVSGLKQKAEGNYGFGILLIGFSVQGISSLLSAPILVKELSFQAITISIIALIIIVLLTFLLTNILIRNTQRKYIKKYVYKVVTEHIERIGDMPWHIVGIKGFLRFLDVSLDETASQEEAWEILKRIAYV